MRYLLHSWLTSIGFVRQFCFMTRVLTYSEEAQYFLHQSMAVAKNVKTSDYASFDTKSGQLSALKSV